MVQTGLEREGFKDKKDDAQYMKQRMKHKTRLAESCQQGLQARYTNTEARTPVMDQSRCLSPRQDGIIRQNPSLADTADHHAGAAVPRPYSCVCSKGVGK